MSRQRLVSIAALSLLAVATGCGSDASRPTGEPQSFVVTWGPVDVPAGTERTQCVVKRLGNTSAIHVGEIHDVLGLSSHHLIVYRVSDTVEQPTPFDCDPFVDTLDPTKGSPLVITQKADETLSLPAGVAFTLQPDQLVRLELHYVNASAAARTVEASSTFTTMPDAAFRDEASFLFIGDPDINVPAMSKGSVGPAYFPLPDELRAAQFFGITGHTHQWGTDVTVAAAAGPTDEGVSVYDVPGWSWDEPATVRLDPPLSFPDGGGFRFSCDYDNRSTADVRFGESAQREMCFFWAYYYPSQGARVCVHTAYRGGFDLCCPGSDLCDFIKAYLQSGG